MKATSGQHFIGLDHLRALAAFMVFSWHFMRGPSDSQGPIDPDYVPAFPPLALLDEGHAGVALFMVLSGYLFARLLDGKRPNYWLFYYNRALRLLPLLAVVVILSAGIQKWRWGVSDLSEYWRGIATGFVLPTLPNGGWSVTAEMHFYLLLPLLLALTSRLRTGALVLLAAAVVARYFYHSLGHGYTLTYFTIFGRLDQFLAGMMAFHCRQLISLRHAMFAALLISVVYWILDFSGGVYALFRDPPLAARWAILPAIEGSCFAVLIAWYDRISMDFDGRLSRSVSYVGELSYSMYLLHVFFVFDMAAFARFSIPGSGNFYLALCLSLMGFLMLLPVAALSYHTLEKPFLRMRRPYLG